MKTQKAVLFTFALNYFLAIIYIFILQDNSLKIESIFAIPLYWLGGLLSLVFLIPSFFGELNIVKKPALWFWGSIVFLLIGTLPIGQKTNKKTKNIFLLLATILINFLLLESFFYGAAV